jgi:acyl phosphate:glycerol-3-phosphate acyltransferase
LNTIAVTLAGYLLGSLPWGYWLPLWTRGVDIRTRGSGNMGAANVAREVGTRIGISVAVLDIAKGTAATLVGLQFAGTIGGLCAGAAAMLGHYRPIFLKFARGGKSVATGCGVALAIVPVAALVGAVVWVTLFLSTRYSSVASLSGCIAIPLTAYLMGAGTSVMVFLIVLAAVVVWLHRTNIARLVRGKENRFTFSRRPWKARA